MAHMCICAVFWGGDPKIAGFLALSYAEALNPKLLNSETLNTPENVKKLSSPASLEDSIPQLWVVPIPTRRRGLGFRV